MLYNLEPWKLDNFTDFGYILKWTWLVRAGHSCSDDSVRCLVIHAIMMLKLFKLEILLSLFSILICVWLETIILGIHII